MQIFFEPRTESVNHKAQASLSSLVTKFRQDDRSILLMLSGGSALHLLSGLSEELADKSITLTVLDDRFTRDMNDNNYLRMQQFDFYTHLKIVGSGFIDTVPQAGESLEELAERFEAQLTQWRAWNDDGVVVATLGMGADGHTAGISPMPNQKDKFYTLFHDTSRLVVGYEGSLEPPQRITVTSRFLIDKVEAAIAFVSGDSKKEAMQKLQDDHGWWHETPARIWREMKDVQVFTDIEI